MISDSAADFFGSASHNIMGGNDQGGRIILQIIDFRVLYNSETKIKPLKYKKI